MRVALVRRLLPNKGRRGRQEGSEQIWPSAQALSYLNLLKYLKLHSYQIETDLGSLGVR
jgi:hypothetical protein